MTPESPEVIEAIKNFQSFANLNITGRLDNATLRIMTLPRCGEIDTDDGDSDIEEFHGSHNGSKGSKIRLSRQKRYILQGEQF
jgi:matrix metalloproteinase-14 (membrane-inserted)